MSARCAEGESGWACMPKSETCAEEKKEVATPWLTLPEKGHQLGILVPGFHVC